MIWSFRTLTVPRILWLLLLCSRGLRPLSRTSRRAGCRRGRTRHSRVEREGKCSRRCEWRERDGSSESGGFIGRVFHLKFTRCVWKAHRDHQSRLGFERWRTSLGDGGSERYESMAYVGRHTRSRVTCCGCARPRLLLRRNPNPPCSDVLPCRVVPVLSKLVGYARRAIMFETVETTGRLIVNAERCTLQSICLRHSNEQRCAINHRA